MVDNNDIDVTETLEWLDAFASVVKYEGRERAGFIIQALVTQAHLAGVPIDGAVFTSPYVNTIPVAVQPEYPGDLAIEQNIEALIRWNAMAMVLQAKKNAPGVGGHLASYASIATLYEVGLQHFFRASNDQALGDLIYFQGHSAEGNYARAFLEGRLSSEHLSNFRQELAGKGLSSYPHPWLMPDFWQFATVSLGLGPLQAVYQARFMRYLQQRKLMAPSERKVWAFCGDGEMDEAESLAGISLAGRERLDNLIFVINCNLQRLDGLVRGNAKIISELERQFHAAGWLVIKVLWDSNWDQLFAQDKHGLLQQRLANLVDGELQIMHTLNAAERRQLLAGSSPELQALLANLSDDLLLNLGRGAHDRHKVYAAYAAAMQHQGQPVVILAQGIKGYGLGLDYGESRNIAHNQLSMSEEGLQAFRTRFNLALTDEQLRNFAFYCPSQDSAEIKYLHAQRAKLGGYLPQRCVKKLTLTIPPLTAFNTLLSGSGERDMSTTMVLNRFMQVLLKDSQLASRVVPIFSDEARTFGMEALFRQLGIYSPVGQLYTPEDQQQFLYYREAEDGQVLQEGITEAGCMASWIAAATAYSTHDLPMIPFFVYYSMFGFQRVGDLIWAAGDMRARGFLIGATAGRTTLQGEGLQHQDGHSLVSAAALPNCRAYDPAFAYEMAVIMHDGLRQMYEKEQDVFYYIMAMNERYQQPSMPAGVEEGIIKGLYQLPQQRSGLSQLQLLGGGAILREVIAAADLLFDDFGIIADVFSVTSFNILSQEGMAVTRNNRLHPDQVPQLPYVQTCLGDHQGPIVAASDYVRLYAEQIRPLLTRPYYTLGTDGFGRSDTREKLRQFFEVDRYYIVVTALYALAQQGKIAVKTVTAALKQYKIDCAKPNPFTV
jgi:pyruvate dehydrogenase E1 component